MEWKKISLRVFKSSAVYLHSTMFKFYLQNTIFHTNSISEILLYFYNVLYSGISRFLPYLFTNFLCLYIKILVCLKITYGD